MMITRKDYLDGKATHAEYYRAVAKTAGVSYRKADSAFLQRVRAALDEGDEHLNTISLDEWDARAWSLLPTVRYAFLEHGEQFSLAGGVCLCKQAARDAAIEKSRKEQ
jgi:hypothetical protein